MGDRNIENKLRTVAAGWRADHDVEPLIDVSFCSWVSAWEGSIFFAHPCAP